MTSLLKRIFRLGACRKRYEIINHFVKTRGYRRYLEIGVSSGRSMGKVRCPVKVGVDPRPRTGADGWTLHIRTSDDFFRENQETFDIVFIDGLHHAEQVLRDIYNSLSVLTGNGIVFLHDCNPRAEETQLREHAPGGEDGWNGDVWKAIAYLRRSVPDLYCRVLDTDQGIGVVVPRNRDVKPSLSAEMEESAARLFEELTWQGLVEHRAEWLGILQGVPELEEELRREGLCPPSGPGGPLS